MSIFIIDGTDFGIGEVVCKIENGVIRDLTIDGSEEITKSLADDENGKWSWIMHYPPKVFFRDVPFEQKEIEITEDLLDEYDISFYWHEHHDIFGMLTISDSQIKIIGEVCQHITGKKLHSVEIMLKR